MIMRSLCESLHLLHDDGGVVRVPMLVKGKIVAPPKIARDAIIAAFEGKPDDVTHVNLENAQVLREPIIDRKTMQHTGAWQYQVLARLDPLALIERDERELVATL